LCPQSARPIFVEPLERDEDEDQDQDGDEFTEGRFAEPDSFECKFGTEFKKIQSKKFLAISQMQRIAVEEERNLKTELKCTIADAKAKRLQKGEG
jgi:hypothetical protein